MGRIVRARAQRPKRRAPGFPPLDPGTNRSPEEVPEKTRRAYELLPRIGTTSADRLRWAVRKVQAPLGQMTAADLENLRLELQLFAAVQDLDGLSGYAIHSGVLSHDLPRLDEVPEILQGMRKLIKAIVHDDRTIEHTIDRYGPFTTLILMRWSASQQRYVAQMRFVRGGWKEMVMRSLVELVLKHGHLLKECPAPKKRVGGSAICGDWFLANRPKQEYCTATCRSRAAMRAQRAGTETAAMVKRKRSRLTPLASDVAGNSPPH